MAAMCSPHAVGPKAPQTRRLSRTEVVSSMPPDEFKNLIVECAWLFPGHGASIMHDDPLMPLQVSGPDAHQSRGSQEVRVSGDNERWSRDGRNLRQRIGRRRTG